MITEELTSIERSRRWREVMTIYLVMTVGTVLVDQLASIWSLLAGFSVLLVALGFIFLPTEWLMSRGESPKNFGIGACSNHQGVESIYQRGWRSTKQALWISCLVFPLFIAGTHLWRTWQGHEATLEQRAFARWEESVRGFNHRTLLSGDVSLGANADQIRIRWRLKPGEKKITHYLMTDGAEVRLLSKNRTTKLSKPIRPKQPWVINSSTSGFITLSTETATLKLESKLGKRPLPSKRYRLGEYGAGLNETQKVTVERNFQWLWSIFLIQLFLVGLPEEIFYRGYVQTRLDSLLGRDRKVFGVPFNWASTILCSVLFALAHLATIHHPARLAVFFPSLLFGWMRRAYHDTLAPAIFHALCNVLSQLLWGVYALS